MSSVTLCPQAFRKAVRSQSGGECVEYTRLDGYVFLRDDKAAFGTPADGILVFTEQQFDEYQAGVRGGDTTGLCLDVTQQADGRFVFRSAVDVTDSTELVFSAGEVEAFVDGIINHEFDNEGARTACSVECTATHREVELAAV